MRRGDTKVKVKVKGSTRVWEWLGDGEGRAKFLGGRLIPDDRQPGAAEEAGPRSTSFWVKAEEVSLRISPTSSSRLIHHFKGKRRRSFNFSGQLRISSPSTDTINCFKVPFFAMKPNLAMDNLTSNERHCTQSPVHTAWGGQCVCEVRGFM